MRRSATFLLGVLLLRILLGGQAPSSSQRSDAAKPPTLNIPADTALLARLNRNLDLPQCKAGEEVQAETTDDAKKGKDVLLKKGSIAAGHISFVERKSPWQPDNMVGIQFDRVTPKNGPEQPLQMIVRALAPPVQFPANPTPGFPHPRAFGIEPLGASSVGVSNIPGLRLGVRRSSSGQQTTVLAWAEGDIKLKKGSQLLLLVVSQ